ncbi:MerR family transcriptional regulator [Levilactobacillus acidifarinae]|uniref:MerR family transcriptional regulator n=1 Tax=Levilactobacillus acidifarinae DSM 19394 = JCM 15949 TaxID=1423715 RepID=A0A0R1LIY6_9LACO|nr:MerR family transcriptional regulator [Levilactobacillus acidifarinae]KRK95883.1 MerR family transcriptional regulator [Levilactobacillus acidifarinae DSM 19394]GEO69183.1 transcriptional regulator [Levilactobacillus acidifarinae]
MPYSIQALAKLAGLSPRTLRYYDQIGLLPAQRNPHNGYREYSAAQVDRLQRIRYWQTFGFTLTAIQKLLTQPLADQDAALRQQRETLRAEQVRLTELLQQLDRTLAAHQGGPQLTDSEKFTAFKHQALTANDQQYGAETRQRYGQAAVTASQQRFAALSAADYQAMQAIEAQLLVDLTQVAQTQDLTGATAKHIFTAHKDWLCFTWNNYTAAQHRGLAQLYRTDPRFQAYYDRKTGQPNAGVTLAAIIEHFTA